MDAMVDRRAVMTGHAVDEAAGGPIPAGAVLPHHAVIFDLEAVVTGTAGAHATAGTVELLRRLRAGRVRLAVVTAGRDAQVLLTSAGLAGVFDVVMDGWSTAGVGLADEPDPAMLLQAARRLHATPARAAVVQATAAGVRAARLGGFALVVGIAGGGQREALEAAGADLIVADASQLDLGALRADPWLLVYEGFDPAHEGHREALTTLANGYLGTRGASPEHGADGVHYPGTYLAGVYNRLTSTVHGRTVQDEHLVNAPNWLHLDICTDTGRWWSDGGLTASAERRELDLRRGVLTRHAVLTDPAGRRLRLTQRRLVSMDRPHLAALHTTLVADGWSGPVTVASGIDAGVRNRNVAEYRALADEHLRTIAAEHLGHGILLVEAQTVQSQVRIATAARTTVTGTRTDDAASEASRRDPPSTHWHLTLRDGQPVTVDKTVAVFTSRDRAIASARVAAVAELDRAPGGFDDLLPAHEAAWARLWHRFRVELDADRQTQLVLNLHVFHLLQSVSPHTASLDAGVPARGLHGEGYRGHVFWDELFVLPVLTAHLPWVSRALLDYRHRRLDAARQAAAAARLPGAMFPWQSGSDGREETPQQLYNLRSGRWMPDNSRRQRHVGLAVAYNAWQYHQSTGDTPWLAHRGADLIIEVARLFTGLATYDPSDDRYHIGGVMGPDEYHDGYPDAPGEGLRDNAYTNVLAAWVCRRAGDVLALTSGHDCDDLIARLHITTDEVARWEHLSRRLTVPFHDAVISQFAGYETLRELDWDAYRARYGNIGRLDLILEAEGDSTNQYKLAKQADVLMLIYLLGPDELRDMLDRLGYRTHTELLSRTVDYYLARTAHGSTLSRVVHASVLARMDPTRAWQTFREALAADLDDTQGGTTSEGIHLGAMAATIDIVTRAFAGARLADGTVTFDPQLPQPLRSARFTLVHRGQRLHVDLDQHSIEVAADPCATNPQTHVRVADVTTAVPGGHTMTFPTLSDRHVSTADGSTPASCQNPATPDNAEATPPAAQP
jgi:trehalose/maltose hydrolase-like predicted phosphorylase